MKKVLLSLSMLAAVAVANAQNFKIWNAADGTGFMGAGTPYIFAPGSASFTVDTVKATSPHIITLAGVAGSNCGDNGTSACYYINGVGNGSYAEAGTAQAFGYTAANFATDKFYMNVNAPGTKLKIQFGVTGSADKYGYEFAPAATGTTYADESIAMSSFLKLVGDNPTGAPLTQAIAATITSIEIVLVKTDGGGVGASYAKFKNISIGTSSALSKQSAAANIASTRVFPNPSTSAFTAEVSLKNAASSTIILSDLVGKQIATKSVDASGQANFETAGLSAGTYVVTYVVDGAPAKSELVVVK